MTRSRALIIHAFAEDPGVITAALRVARNASQALPDALVEVVVQGIAVTGLTVHGGFDEDLAATMRAGLSVVACGNSMQRAGLDPSRLLKGVEVVSSAVVHIAERQWAGAAYVRV